jgi:hypothetical protein
MGAYLKPKWLSESFQFEDFLFCFDRNPASPRFFDCQRYNPAWLTRGLTSCNALVILMCGADLIISLRALDKYG